MGGEITARRRRLLELIGSAGVVAVAGCTGGGGEPGTEAPTPTSTPESEMGGAEVGEEMDEEDHEELPPGVSEEEFVSGPVPEPYRTAASQAGEERDPESLSTKEAVRFQEAEEAVAAGLAPEGNDCGNCAEYIADKNGDGFGACATVEGYVDPADWCVLWESIEEHEAEEAEDDEEGE